MTAILWTSLVLLILASFKSPYRLVLGGIGWALFGVHWVSSSFYYVDLADYFNVILTLLVAVFCVLIAKKMLFGGRETGDIVYRLTRVTAVGGMVYFMLSQIPLLNTGIISTVTDQTIWMIRLFGYEVQPVEWNMMRINTSLVEIILACTAIESIALFIGLITTAGSNYYRMFKAFAVSVPVIYLLNLFRNTFITVAFGNMWFGPPAQSFFIAHSIIAKIGSALALLVISYMVLRILPEVLDLIQDLSLIHI